MVLVHVFQGRPIPQSYQLAAQVVVGGYYAARGVLFVVLVYVDGGLTAFDPP